MDCIAEGIIFFARLADAVFLFSIKIDDIEEGEEECIGKEDDWRRPGDSVYRNE